MARQGVRIFFSLLVASAVALLVSCDRDPPRALPSTTPAAPVFELELKPLTPLVPNRPTHVAVDRLGNIYWVQEGDRQDDTMFVIGEGEVPRATQLSAGNIAAALGASGGRGNIHGIAAGASGEIYFYFIGAQARRTLAAIGQYTPRTAKVRILADTDAVAAATRMGRSLPLARGTMIGDGRFVWAWVHHSDDASLFKIDPTKLPSDGPAMLIKPFESVKFEGKPIALTREEYDLAPAPDSNLFLLDSDAGRILKIDPAGAASLVRSLTGLPRGLSTPTVDRRGQLLMFAARPETNTSAASKPPTPDGEVDPGLIPPSTAPAADAPSVKPLDLSFPAMLMYDGDKLSAIERDRIMAYPGFPVFDMRIRELIANPTDEGWVAYDAGSGELLRLKIHEKLWH